ncbi:MAG: hypothetical protein H5T80_11605 [Dietzia sp.]|nr:hypothetical protein [Dietzia sp.]
MRRPIALLATALLLVAGAGAAQAAGHEVTYRGQGLAANETGGYDLGTEICDVEDGAESDEAYLLWVFTATRSTDAKITGPWGTADMEKTSNGTFKFLSRWYELDGLVGEVSATHDGATRNPQLVISHGCPPAEEEEPGAWCSPGYWRNASDAAWALTGFAKTDLFNDTVVPGFYDTASGAGPTLIEVLTTSNANTFGAASAPFDLNAFNATGAFLTDQIPGFHFDPALIGVDEACPIDNGGNFK